MDIKKYFGKRTGGNNQINIVVKIPIQRDLSLVQI